MNEGGYKRTGNSVKRRKKISIWKWIVDVYERERRKVSKGVWICIRKMAVEISEVVRE